MKRGARLLAGVLSMASAALAAPKGTVPRSAASLYPAHVQRDGVSIGARLLSPDEARRAFVSDVNRCCLVVEIALYPLKGKPTEVSLDNFSLRITGTETAAKPSTPKVVAASLQKKAQDTRDITISPSVGVGYGSGSAYDPVTGRRSAGGVYTGVAVAIGGPAAQPASTDRDRSAMETELGEKGLPEGSSSIPIAGYMYFPQARQSKKKAVHQLEYMLNGNKVVLALD